MTTPKRPSRGSRGKPDLTGPRLLATALSAFTLANDRFRATLAKQLNLSPTDLRAMNTIRTLGEATPKSVAHQLDLTAGSVTPLVDRIEKRDFVERVPHPNDRRSIRLQLTPAGDDALRWALDQYVEAIASALGSTPELRAEDVVSLLGVISAGLEEISGESESAPRGG